MRSTYAARMWLVLLGAAAAAAITFAVTRRAEELIEVANAGEFTFSREPLTGNFAVSDTTGRLGVDIDAQSNFFIQGAFEFDGTAYLLVYNTAENVPSGRALSRGAEGSDVLRVRLVDGAPTFEKVASLPIGIDVRVLTSLTDGHALVCATTTCMSVRKNSIDALSFEPVHLPKDHEVVELAGDMLLLQHVFNDQYDQMPPASAPIFAVCATGSAEVDCTPVPPNIIPYDLQVDGSYSTATDFETLLRFDYDRIGVADYGQSNLEARIAWSSTYYLAGLANLYGMPISDQFKVEIKERLTKEITAIADLVETTNPGMAARRYSLDREAITFLLHIARAATLVQTARPVIGDALADRTLAPLLSELRNPQNTVEVLAPGPRSELLYRQSMPFWADGSNVPWNYQSGWIEAVALTGMPDNLADPIAGMLHLFALEESLATKPDKWSYAGGVFNTGWTEGVSVNTPTFAGQAALNIPAHISYRSMDALAVLAVEDDGISPLPDFEAYAADLVSRGHLYPFVNAGLSTPAPIPFAIARHYSRAYRPSLFQNQVWAASAMMR